MKSTTRDWSRSAKKSASTHRFERIKTGCSKFPSSLGTILRRKPNRIPPLDQVFHLFALINLMNEFGCVVHQTHRHLARNSSASEPIDIGNPQAVKAKVGFLHLDEELLPSPRWLEREFQRVSSLLIRQPLQQWSDRGRHWNRESPLFAPLRMGEGDLVFTKVHTV